MNTITTVREYAANLTTKRNRSGGFATILLAIMAVIVASPLGAQQFVYVNNNSFPNRLSAYSISTGGVLTPVPGAPFLTGGNGGLCWDIDSVSIRVIGGFVYATNYGTGTVSGFKINPNGSLTAVPGSPFAGSAGGFFTGLAESPDGKFLYVGRNFFPSGMGIDSFAIDPVTGALSLGAGSPFGVGGGAGFDVIFDSLRSNVISDVNFNKVAVFNGGGTGTLTAIVGSPFTTPTTNNHKMALRPQDDCLFVAGGSDPRIAAMTISPGGQLSNAPGSPVSTTSVTIGATVTPQGNYAYFGAIGGIFGYSTDGTCKLVTVPGSPFASGGSSPAGLTTDAGGNFVLALNTFSGSVSSLAIADNGSLLVTDTKTLQGASSCPVGITATPCTPPVISNASLSQNSLWPPNHNMVPVTVNYTNSSNCPDTCALTVTSNEAVNGFGDGNAAPDWEVLDATHVLLRAERTGAGTGRVYTITITCTNSAGQSASQTVHVVVHHDKA